MEILEKIKSWLKTKKDDEPTEVFYQRWQDHLEDLAEIDKMAEAIGLVAEQMLAANPMLFDEQFMKRLVRASVTVFTLHTEKGKEFAWALYEERDLEILQVVENGVEVQVAEAADEAWREIDKMLGKENSRELYLDYAFGTPEMEEAALKSEKKKQMLRLAAELASATAETMKILHFHLRLIGAAVARAVERGAVKTTDER